MSVSAGFLGNIAFASTKESVVARLGDGSPQVTQGYGGWNQVTRGKRKSLTTWAGSDPLQITIPVMFDRFEEGTEGVSVEADVSTLERLAGLGIEGEPPTIVFNSLGLVPHDSHDDPKLTWVIDAIEWGEPIRNSHGNRVRQECTVTVLEYVPDIVVPEQSAAKRASNKKSASSPGAKSKRYTVKKGDTLQKIAKAQLGSQARWTEIAKLNKIRDPRKLKVGQVLKLP